MKENLILKHEQYRKSGIYVINYVVYSRSDGIGDDKVLQHKINNSETAHITLHPDGIVNFRIVRFKHHLEEAIKNNLLDYTPSVSDEVQKFIMKIHNKHLFVQRD